MGKLEIDEEEKKIAVDAIWALRMKNKKAEAKNKERLRKDVTYFKNDCIESTIRNRTRRGY